MNQEEKEAMIYMKNLICFGLVVFIICLTFAIAMIEIFGR
jgi:hypothetical protein